MDFDDDDLKPSINATARRFAPKSSKLKPKKEPQLVPKPEPPSTKTEPREIDLTVKQNEVEHTKSEPNGTESSKFEVREDDDSRNVDSTDVGMTDVEHDSNLQVIPMDEEYTVVREIDVYFSPYIDDETKLYVMQYPLRPSWRPYELEDNCEEIRLKPRTSEVEIDLSVDLESSNIDRDNANTLNYTKQVNASINCRIHQIITRKQQRVPITRLNNPVLSFSSSSSTFLSNSSNCYSSNKVGRKSMASSSSNAMFGDVYVDDLISSYNGVQDFTKHAGVSFKDRTHKGFMKASVSFRRPQQLLYGPLNFGRSTFDASWRIQNAGLLPGLWSKNLFTSSACCLAGTAHDLSYESNPPDELENSSTLPNFCSFQNLYTATAIASYDLKPRFLFSTAIDFQVCSMWTHFLQGLF